MKTEIKKLNKKRIMKHGTFIENGVEFWFKYGKRYIKSNDIPVINQNGNKEYYLDGKLHKEDGPAIEGNLTSPRWYLDGKKYSPEGHLKEMRRRKIESLKC